MLASSFLTDVLSPMLIATINFTVWQIQQLYSTQSVKIDWAAQPWQCHWQRHHNMCSPTVVHGICRSMQQQPLA